MNPDADPFQKIHDEFRPRIHRYLSRMVGETEADDLAQEVFVKIDKALPGFRGASSLSTWIYRVATNTALDHLRSAASRNSSRNDELPDGDEPLRGEADVEESKSALPPDSLLIQKDMNDCIRSLVDGLPELYRTVLVLSDLEGLTNAEIAGVVGVSLDAVKIRLNRARTKLRNEMEKKCVFYRDERNELACDRRSLPLKFSAK
jgi:RNA polymerase sigma-70 factor (ECF subfamily)